MKRFVFILIVWVGFLSSCQEKEGIFDDSSKPVSDEIFNRYLTPSSLLVADSSTIQRLFAEFSTEQEALSNQFKADNPSLWGEYQDDCKAVGQLKDKKLIEDKHKAMSLKYKAEMLKSFKNLNLNKSDITSRAKNILGDIPFQLGDFYEIIITSSRDEDGIALPAAMDVRSSEPYEIKWYAYSHDLPHSEPPFIDNGAYYAFVNALIFMKVSNAGIYAQRSDIPASYSKVVVEYPSIPFTENLNLFCSGGGAESSISVYGTMDFFNGNEIAGAGSDIEIYRKQVIAIVGGIHDSGDLLTNTEPTRKSWLLSSFPASTGKVQTGYKISLSTESYGFSSSSSWTQAIITVPVNLHYYN